MFTHQLSFLDCKIGSGECVGASSNRSPPLLKDSYSWKAFRRSREAIALVWFIKIKKLLAVYIIKNKIARIEAGRFSFGKPLFSWLWKMTSKKLRSTILRKNRIPRDNHQATQTIRNKITNQTRTLDRSASEIDPAYQMGRTRKTPYAKRESSRRRGADYHYYPLWW